jgi:hypothetical protein
VKQLKPRLVGLLLASIGVAACGGSSSPTSPTTPPATTNIAGAWTQVGGTRTWSLTQVGVQVGGSTSFSQDNNPTFGAVSGTGGVVGAATFGTFTFAETFERLSLSSRPNLDCYVDVNGQLTISGDSMTGSYTEVDACAGVHLGQVTGKLTMQRK